MNPSIGPSSLESKWVRFSNAESRTKNKTDSLALFLPNHASNIMLRVGTHGRGVGRSGMAPFRSADCNSGRTRRRTGKSASRSSHRCLAVQSLIPIPAIRSR